MNGRPEVGAADQGKKEMMRATWEAHAAHQCFHDGPGLGVVFSSMPTRLFTSQKPESLKWEQTVEPPAWQQRSAVPHRAFTFYFCDGLLHVSSFWG